MNADSKILGGKCQLVVGVGPTAILAGYKAYACKVRVDATQIKSYTKIESDDGSVSVVTNESWESVALTAGEYVSFEDSITSITLNAAGDSVMLFLEPK